MSLRYKHPKQLICRIRFNKTKHFAFVFVRAPKQVCRKNKNENHQSSSSKVYVTFGSSPKVWIKYMLPLFKFWGIIHSNVPEILPYFKEVAWMKSCTRITELAWMCIMSANIVTAPTKKRRGYKILQKSMTSYTKVPVSGQSYSIERERER